MRNFPEKRWRIRVQKGLQNNENASIFIKDLFAHLSRLERLENEICKFQSASNGKNPAILSLLLLLCHCEAIFYAAMAEALGNQNLCQWAWTGTNWDSRSGQKKKNHQGFNIKEFFWFLLCLLHLFLLRLPPNLAVTTPVKNWCIIILSQESDISFSIHKKMFLWSILVVLRLLCNALMDLISRCYYWQNEKLITEPKFQHQIWIRILNGFKSCLDFLY